MVPKIKKKSGNMPANVLQLPKGKRGDAGHALKEKTEARKGGIGFGTLWAHSGEPFVLNTTDKQGTKTGFCTITKPPKPQPNITGP